MLQIPRTADAMAPQIENVEYALPVNFRGEPVTNGTVIVTGAVVGTDSRGTWILTLGEIVEMYDNACNLLVNLASCGIPTDLPARHQLRQLEDIIPDAARRSWE